MNILAFALVWGVLCLGGVLAAIFFIKNRLGLKLLVIGLLIFAFLVGEAGAVLIGTFKLVGNWSRSIQQSAQNKVDKTKPYSVSSLENKPYFDLGETVRGNNFEFTLKNVETKKTVAGQRATEYCLLQTEIKNLGKKTLKVSTDDFTMRDKGGDETDSAHYDFNQEPTVLRNNIEIAPDQTVAKTLVFECSKNLAPYTLNVEIGRTVSILGLQGNDETFEPIRVRFELN